MARHNEIGAIGEGIAAKWLLSRGHSIIERNYRRKWGEIDIVARETDKIHFVEVKTVSYETKAELDQVVSHETWRPEENVHHAKLLRLKRAIETWIRENQFRGSIQIDVLAVRMVPREKIARIKFIENVIVE